MMLIKFNHFIVQNSFCGIYIHSFSALSLVTVVFGLLILFFFKTYLKYCGLIPILIGIMLAYNYRPPDIFITAVYTAVRGADDNLYFLNVRREPKNFVANTRVAHHGKESHKIFASHQNNAYIKIEKTNQDLYIYHKLKKRLLFIMVILK